MFCSHFDTFPEYWPESVEQTDQNSRQHLFINYVNREAVFVVQLEKCLYINVGAFSVMLVVLVLLSLPIQYSIEPLCLQGVVMHTLNKYILS